MRDWLFVALGWTLLALAWVFAVLHLADPISTIAHEQKTLYKSKAWEDHLHEMGFEPVAKEELTRLGVSDVPVATTPTWPIWLVYAIGFPAAFAANFPYWTIIGGILCFSWVYLFVHRLRTSHSVRQALFQKPYLDRQTRSSVHPI